MPSTADIPKSSRLPHDSHPHILDLILQFSEYATLLAFRNTCSSLKTAVARELCRGPLVVDVDEPKEWEEGDGVIVLRTRRGVLPFLREEDWAWAFARADAVEVDAWCLGPPRIGGRRGPRPGPRDSQHGGHCPCMACVALIPEDDDDLHPIYGGDSAATGLVSPCVDLEAIKGALSHIRREVPLTVLHCRDRPTPTYIPATETLILRLDPECDCAIEGRLQSPPPTSPDYTPSYGPLHSASNVIVRISPFSNNDTEPGGGICELAACTLLPSVRHLTISAPSILHSDSILSTMAEGPGPQSGGETRADGTEVRHPELEVDHRLRVIRESEMTLERVEAWSNYLGVSPEKFAFTRDPDAGDLPFSLRPKCRLLNS